MFRCRACESKDSELARATVREAGLLRLVQELQYALHPARLTNPNASISCPQPIESVRVAIDSEKRGAPRVSRETPPPPFVRTLQRGGHVIPLSATALRRAAEGEAS